MSFMRKIIASTRTFFVSTQEADETVIREMNRLIAPQLNTDVLDSLPMNTERFNKLMRHATPVFAKELYRRHPEGYDISKEVFAMKSLRPRELENFIEAGLALDARNERNESLLWLIKPMDCLMELNGSDRVTKTSLWERIVDAGVSFNEKNTDGMTRLYRYFSHCEHLENWVEDGEVNGDINNVFRMHLQAITCNGRYDIDATQTGPQGQSIEQVFADAGLVEPFFNCLSLRRYFLFPVTDLSEEEVDTYKKSSDRLFNMIVERVLDAVSVGHISKFQLNALQFRLDKKRFELAVNSNVWLKRQSKMVMREAL